MAFARLTYPEAEAAAKRGAVLILPVASVEPHGPHLPLDTDAVIAEGMAERAAATLRGEGMEGYVLPTLAYAVTDFARGFGGVVSISRATAVSMLTEVVTALVGQGFRRVVIANAHLEPAHLESIREAVAAIRAATGVETLFPDLTSKRWGRMLGAEFRSGACHAGSFEGSMVLARRPEGVKGEIMTSLPPNPTSLSKKILEGATDFRSAGGDRAYFGDPAAATAEEGELLLDVLAGILVTAVREGRSE
ncbi:MAG: creatininase family protein [Acidobacteria bacterium]|nr:creatininase family protein [Acidobacteriota bacterium]